MQFNYQIALTNVAFDNSYNNVLRFATRSEQEAYFDTNTLFLNKEFINFNATNLLTTNIVYDIGPDESIQKMLNCNYCIVKDSSPNKTLNYYYYFITNAVYLNDKQISVALELDVINTYYIDLQFSDCLIEKGHLNRFIENEDGTVSFDGTVDSKLFEREDIKNVAKRLTNRHKLNLYNYPNQQIINDWFNKNVKGYMYVFVDSHHEFNFKALADASKSITHSLSAIGYGEKGKDKQILNQVAVLCSPVYNGDNIIKVRKGTTEGASVYELNNTGLEYFFKNNNGNANILSIKFSQMPPFNQNDITQTATLDTNGDIILNGDYSIITSTDGRLNFGGCGIWLTDSLSVGNRFQCAILNVTFQTNNYTLPDYEINTQFNFNKNDIVNANKNVKFNPKLLSADYKSIRICDATENGFDYDLQKLNTNKLVVKITEPITPDMTKKYYRLSTRGVYTEDCEHNLTGFVNNDDTSVVLSTTAYQQMLANNKNFFLQNSINRNFDIGQNLSRGILGVGTSGAGIVGGHVGAGILGMVGSTLSMVNAGLNYAESKINENLTIDNLTNAPTNLTNAKGNVYFQNMYSENGVIVEEYDILPNEKQMINDFMCQYGFTVNRLDNPKNYDNIRHFYNYVRASLENITSNLLLSNAVRAKIKEIYANGVRFWNVFNNQTPSFNYNKENYERWLNNE